MSERIEISTIFFPEDAARERKGCCDRHTTCMVPARKEIRTTVYSRFFFLHAYSHEYVDVDAVHSLDA